MSSPTLAALTGTLARIGNLTFGGGSATVAALQREMVDRRQWLDRPTFALCYALSRVTPGTNLLAFCTGVGWRLQGLRGALLAVVASSLPAAAITWVATVGFEQGAEQPLVAAAIQGAVAAAVGILLASFWSLVRPYLEPGQRLVAVAVVGAAIGLSVGLGVSPVRVLLLAAVAGVAWPGRQE